MLLIMFLNFIPLPLNYHSFFRSLREHYHMPVRTTKPRSRSEFRRAIRVRVDRVAGKENGYHFRHKVPVFVVANAVDSFCETATAEEAKRMQEDILAIMTNPIVGSMDPEDENKLDSLWECVWRFHSKDESTINAKFIKIFTEPTTSQKRLIGMFNIQSAKELQDLAMDHVSEGLDILRSLADSDNISSAAIQLLMKEFDKPYLRHFKPTHRGTPNRDRILGRTAEERHLVLYAMNIRPNEPRRAAAVTTTTTTPTTTTSTDIHRMDVVARTTTPPPNRREAETHRLREHEAAAQHRRAATRAAQQLREQQRENQLESLVKRLSIVEAKIADRNHQSRRSADDDLALAIELSTVQELIVSSLREPATPVPLNVGRHCVLPSLNP